MERRIDEIAGIEPGRKLTWRTAAPLIVVGRGKPIPVSAQLTREQSERWDRTWHQLQQDLATRSAKGQYIRAANSGHFVHSDEPDLVIQAIRQIWQPAQ